MCATCGCSDDAGVRVTAPHSHAADHGHGHGHGHAVDRDTRTVPLEVDLLAKNDRLAGRNRRWLAERGVVALNLMSSPGSGKTTLLERTITDLGAELPCAVLEGDQETLLDADRIAATGARVLQINTGAGCHLDADMVAEGVRTLDLEQGSLLFVENVGNLVCPALFDLGESARVVIVSVTEGADKPLKYPHMFRTADLVLVNKIDLLPYVDFDVDRCAGYIRRARPDAEILLVSATGGDGLDDWYSWLRRSR
ncbi:hydrogenase nickel incorporation protein HypB [Pseudonocardia endophytica]|uniref:Hydrogenase nickel incorporation protein HypB n=1 Tax=Pseudonocardia endophytica TaxID=401976 RepID=A0A4R1HMF7_PSEEN|nr:hydrogenase nickel incorporation protein HypB [Pseudonocardia endophytica]TCK22321.1 hydrogenase nickel incorporation protein HypB [Pseudonocardia endophytica]